MIKVGINPNVVLSSAVLTDKGTLQIGFRELGTEVKEKKVQSAAEMLNESSDATEGSGESLFLIFPPNLKKFGSEEVKDGAAILGDFSDLKKQLHHILKRYTTDAQIRWNLLAGTSINANDDADVQAKFQMQTVADKVYNNIATQFIAMARMFINLENKPCRLLLVRQSANKHFGTFRKKFLNNQPFLESMDIPKEQSALLIHTSAVGQKTTFHDPDTDGFLPRFSDYELEKGLDNPIAVKADADKPATSSQEKEVGNIFNAGAGEEAPTFGITAEQAA